MHSYDIEKMLLPLDSNIKQAMMKLNESGEKIVFVVNSQNELQGTITDGDIRRGITSGMLLDVQIENVMHRNCISLQLNTPELHLKAKKLMVKHVIEQVPVIDSKNIIRDVIFVSDILSESEPLHKEPVKTDIPVVIMAGGKGTRLNPITHIIPKALIPVGDKPFIQNIMDSFYKQGFHRFYLILNYKREMIKMYFNDTVTPYSIDYIDEEEYCGTAGGMHLLKGIINEPFILTNCDTMLKGIYMDIFKWHVENKKRLTIVGSHREITIPYGVLSMKDDNLEKIDEKPNLDLFINTGTYIIEPSVINSLGNEFLDMDVLIENINKQNPSDVGVFPDWKGWYDIGQWEEYRKTIKQIGDMLT